MHAVQHLHVHFCILLRGPDGVKGPVGIGMSIPQARQAAPVFSPRLNLEIRIKLIFYLDSAPSMGDGRTVEFTDPMTMNKVVPFLKIATDAQARAAIFLSGSGSNAERILERHRQAGTGAAFVPAVLVTDAPGRSRAADLSRQYDIPIVANDIRTFYRERGEDRVSIATPRGQQIREEWTDHVRRELESYRVDFGILAGFVPLTNLTADMPCLNVHPGDLTYVKNGKRHLVGLHTVPIERALLEGLTALRSSIIVAQPYTGNGGEMDSGPILGISEPVEVDLDGTTFEELEQIAGQRPPRRPKGGFGDRLEQIAAKNQQLLKEKGDWVAFPACVFDFARRRFGHDAAQNLFYKVGERWQPVETVVYGRHHRELIFKALNGSQNG